MNIESKVGVLLAAVFVILALFHVDWTFRGIPTRIPVVPDIPDKPPINPSPASCLGVATALALAAVVTLASADLMLTAIPYRLRMIAGLVLGGVFVLRAVGDFRLVGFFKSVRGTDFASWDSWLYSPLCLAIGIGVLWLSVSRKAGPET